MYRYKTWVTDATGRVVYSTSDDSGNASMDTLKYCKKEFPASKGYTIHENTVIVKRVSYLPEEGH